MTEPLPTFWKIVFTKALLMYVFIRRLALHSREVREDLSEKSSPET